MKFKKMVAALLAVSMISSMGLVGCGKKEVSTGGTTGTNQSESGKKEANTNSNFNPTGDKIVNEPVTLRIVAAKEPEVGDFNELQFFKDLEEKTNVKIEWEIYSSEAWKEQKNLLFASQKELPDAFFGMWTLEDQDIVKYGSQGLLISLDEHIDQYGVNLKNVLAQDPSYEKLMKSPDGKTYGLPGIDESTGGIHGPMYINQKWLDAVGKSVPTTTDEFYDVLKAFKAAGDLNGNGIADEIPMGFRFDSLITGFYQWLGPFGIATERNFIMETPDKKLEFAANTPAYREALEYYSKLYKEGLIDPESFTQTESVYTSKLKSENRIYGAGTIWSMHNAFGTDDVEVAQYVPMLPLKGPSGKQVYLERPGGLRSNGAFAITSNCKIPEVAMRWADAMYETKTARQAYYGLEGVAIEKAENDMWKMIDTGGEDLRHKEAPGKRAIPAITKEMYAQMEKSPGIVERDKIFETYEPFIYSVPKKPMKTMEEMDELGVIEVEITDYVKKMTAEFISKGVTDDGWNTYCKALEGLNLARYMELYNQIYDRYTSN